MTLRVVVVGAGPGGTAAATTLARAGAEVTVLEAGSFPRHRLCGEFLSPEALPVIRAMGVGDVVLDAAPALDHVIATVARAGRERARLDAPLPAAGRGLSRVVLDAALAACARRAGATVRERARVQALEASGDALVAHASDGDVHADAAVLATGRLARPRGARTDRRGASLRHVGVKVHVRGLSLGRTTELHFVRGAYVGLNDVLTDGGVVTNVCALLSPAALDDLPSEPLAMLERLAAASPGFARRWTHARADERTLATAAGFGFDDRGAAALLDGAPVLVVGDAAAAVTPLVGDGQASALANGVEAALALLEADAPAERYRRRHARSMRGRLATGRALQGVLLRPRAAGLLVGAVARLRPVVRSLFAATRGPLIAEPGAGLRPLATDPDLR